MSSSVPVRRAANKAQAPAPERRGSWDRMVDDLQAQGGLVAQFVHFARTIREAANDVHLGVIHLASALDQERRGPLSALTRGDSAAVLQNIEAQLAGALDTPRGTSDLVHRLAGIVQELQAHIPAETLGASLGQQNVADEYRAALARQSRESGRRIARALGATVPEPESEPAPTAPSPGFSKGFNPEGRRKALREVRRIQKAKARR